jgi:uncharacterized transporter YbjL
MDLKNFNYLDFNLTSNANSADLTNKPRLVAPGVKYFFKSILKECHTIKEKNYNMFYNFAMLGVFIIILGIILYSKYKGNRTPEEQYLKTTKDKQYIMSKLVYYNRQNLDNQQKVKNNMITNLPDYNNHPEASILHEKLYF